MKKYYTPRMGLASRVLIDHSKLAEGCVVNAQPDEELVVHGHTPPRYSLSGEEELHLRNLKGERVGVANLRAATEVGEDDDDGYDEDADDELENSMALKVTLNEQRAVQNLKQDNQSGDCGFISHLILVEALRAFGRIGPNEVVVSLEIDDNGIKYTVEPAKEVARIPEPVGQLLSAEERAGLFRKS